MAGYQIITFKSEKNYEVRTETYQGKKFLVVPVVMMVEGVHNGSKGPLFHSIDELGRFPESWNGIPVVVNHPERDGHAISANSPEVLDSDATIGQVFNTYVDGTKLRSEAWLEEGKLKKSTQLYNQIKKQQVVEVSVGVFSDEEPSDGEWNGEPYSAIAHNHRPDHLALLPGGTGACSVKDGCGIRTNNLNEEVEMPELKEQLQILNKEGYALRLIQVDAQQAGYKEMVDKIRNQLYGKNTEKEYHFLEEVYKDSFIYEVNREGQPAELYRQPYQINDQKNVDFLGEPTRVTRKVEYVNVNSKKETKMTCTQCVERKVNFLIANKANSFTEEDREFLQSLPEDQLDKMMPVKTPETNAQQVPPAAPAQEIQAMSEQDKADMEYGRKIRAEKKATLVKGIQDNTEKDLWSADILNAMDIDMLEKLFKSVEKQPKPQGGNYSLNSHAAPQVNVGLTEEDVLLPAGIQLK